MALCRLCRLHQHLTTGAFDFWVEWDDEGLPRLVMDSPNRVDGTHALQIIYCPMCGQPLRMPTPRNAHEAEAAAEKAKDGAGEQKG